MGAVAVDWGQVDDLLKAGEVQAPASRLLAPYVVDATEARSMVRSAKWRHYVYLLCGPGGDVFYIGKGVDGRLLQHAVDAACGDDSDKAEMIRRLGDQLRYCVYAFFEDDNKARIGEAALIQKHWAEVLNLKRETVAGVLRTIAIRSFESIAAEQMDAALDLEALAREARKGVVQAMEAAAEVRRRKRGQP